MQHLGVGIGVFQGLTNIALNGIVLGVICTGGYLVTTHEINPGMSSNVILRISVLT